MEDPGDRGQKRPPRRRADEYPRYQGDAPAHLFPDLGDADGGEYGDEG